MLKISGDKYNNSGISVRKHCLPCPSLNFAKFLLAAKEFEQFAMVLNPLCRCDLQGCDIWKHISNSMKGQKLEFRFAFEFLCHHKII